MKKFVFIILIALTSNLLYGQNHSDLLKRINEIKKMQESYFWSQSTYPNADTAKVNAFKWLLLEVNGSREESEQLSLEDIEPFVKFVKIDRGNLKQFFVYIKKEDVGLKPAKRQTVLAEASVEKAANPSVKSLQKAFVPDVFVQKVIQQKNFYSVYNFLKAQKAQGTVLQFGPLKEVEDYSSLELILFDMQSKEIISILSPENTERARINMITGMRDSMENYPEDMVLVIWYIK